MFLNFIFLSCLSTFSLVVDCSFADDEIFDQRYALGTIEDPEIPSVAGMAKSSHFSDVLYVHRSRGGENRIFAVDKNTGSKMATFTINGAENVSWEDLAYGPCFDDCKAGNCSAAHRPPRNCIYIADTGSYHGSVNTIYAIREPAQIQDQDIDLLGTMRFDWFEYEAKTLMVSPEGRLYIISTDRRFRGRGGNGKVTSLPSFAWNSGREAHLDMSKTWARTVQIPIGRYADPQGGSISSDGKEVVLAGNDAVWYYRIPNATDSMSYIVTLGTETPHKVAEHDNLEDPEAIAWDHSGQGFYLIPDGGNSNLTIYYYPKLQEGQGSVIVG